jgi:hypothetical protein
VERALAEGRGERLPEPLRDEAERRFGVQFDDLRIHQGQEANRFARAAGARAFTLGRDVVFGPGQYEPRSAAGRALLWHELGHVAERRPGALLRAPLYDTTQWTVSPPPPKSTHASVKALVNGRIASGDITSASIVGVKAGSDQEMYLLYILYQLGTKANRGRVMKVQAEVAPPIGSVGQLGLATVTIDDSGAATVELVQQGPLVEPLAYTKADAIKKITTDYGAAGVEVGDKDWEESDVNDVVEALALIPAGDRAALKGVTFVRFAKLTDQDTGKELAGQFSSGSSHINTGARSVTVDQRPELRFADSAFTFGNRFLGAAGKTLPSSYQLILHEVAHAVERQARREAQDTLNTAVIKQNTSYQAAEAARAKWKDAFSKGQGITPFKASFDRNITANKAAVKASAKARTGVDATQVSVTVVKGLETDAKTKQGAATAALATADAAATGWSAGDLPASQAYRQAVAAVEAAIGAYAKDVGAGKSVAKADVDLLAVVAARDTAREALKKSAAANPAPGVYAAVETAQAEAIDALRTVAHTRGRTLRLQRFKDVVDKNKITPFTQYARDNWPYNPEEFYAEAYALWLTDPTFVMTSYKPIFDFFDTGDYTK